MLSFTVAVGLTRRSQSSAIALFSCFTCHVFLSFDSFTCFDLGRSQWRLQKHDEGRHNHSNTCMSLLSRRTNQDYVIYNSIVSWLACFIIILSLSTMSKVDSNKTRRYQRTNRWILIEMKRSWLTHQHRCWFTRWKGHSMEFILCLNGLILGSHVPTIRIFCPNFSTVVLILGEIILTYGLLHLSCAKRIWFICFVFWQDTDRSLYSLDFKANLTLQNSN